MEVSKLQPSSNMLKQTVAPLMLKSALALTSLLSHFAMTCLLLRHTSTSGERSAALSETTTFVATWANQPKTVSFLLKISTGAHQPTSSLVNCQSHPLTPLKSCAQSHLFLLVNSIKFSFNQLKHQRWLMPLQALYCPQNIWLSWTASLLLFTRSIGDALAYQRAALNTLLNTKLLETRLSEVSMLRMLLN